MKLYQNVDSTLEQVSYIMAVLVGWRGCPRCGGKTNHTKNCALHKIIDNFESKIRDLPEETFD